LPIRKFDLSGWLSATVKKVEIAVTLRIVQEFKLPSRFDRHLRRLGIQKTLEKVNEASFQTQLPELSALMIAGH
tara:strand:+ start:105 stop:326 length:222 start_codon:yes stop_codon:yes gene_type:complete